jgi:hypothetical protein
MKDKNQTLAPLVIGLHITKCAGTSFATTVRGHLTDDCYYFCSSYFENWIIGRPLLVEMLDRSRIRVIFGHFCHEYLLSVFRSRRVVLITGLRNPLRRAISHFKQLNAIRFAAGLPLATAYEFLMRNPNAICREILRCFPCIDQASDEPKWLKAASALSLFDYIYSTENLAEDSEYLFMMSGMQSAKLLSDNISDEKGIPSQITDQIERQIRVIEREFDEYFDQDIKLYETMGPYLSRPNLQEEMAFNEQPWRIDRDRYVAQLLPETEALHAFAATERRHLAYEFATRGRAQELMRQLDERIAGLRDIKKLTDRFDRELNVRKGS